MESVIETYRRVAGGMIGEIVTAHVSRMGGSLWYKPREAGWSDMEYLLRNWTSFCSTSGDFVVEMFVHEIDLMTWFLGDKLPVKAEATGGRARRVTGDMYDHFSMTYVYDNGMRTHCTSRQIAGCNEQIKVTMYGTKGHADPRNGEIYSKDGSLAWKYERPKRDDPQARNLPSATVQTHIQVVNAIRSGTPFNKADQLANSTLIAILGREAAYTGKFISWDEIMASNQKLTFDKYEFGPIPGFSEDIPLAGRPAVI
jgi:predicted dehydrogenase